MASWRHGALVEPDTPQDAGWGWEDPGPPDRSRVYFNAYAVQTYPGESIGKPSTIGPSPSLLPGAGVAPGGWLAFHALLGVWKDCDGDGYVGSSILAAWRYPAHLLPPGSACIGSAHVTEDVVTEYLHLQYDHPTASPVISIHDPDARVWTDFGRPGDPPVFQCRLFPLSKAVLTSTGGILQHADCQQGFVLSASILPRTEGLGPLDLSFDDPHHPERDCGNPLNQETIWGNPHCMGGAPLPGGGRLPVNWGVWEDNTGHPAFRVWDCSQPGTRISHDLPDEAVDPAFEGLDAGRVGPLVSALTPDGAGVFIPAFSPAVHPVTPTWSLYDAAVQTWEATAFRCQPYQGSPVDFALLLVFAGLILTGGAENLENTASNAYINGPQEAPRPKRSSDFTYRSWANHLTWSPFFAEQPYWGQGVEDLAAPGWGSAEKYSFPVYRGGTTKQNLEASGPLWFTSYATVGQDTQSLYDLPRTTPSAYGAEACDGNVLQVIHGWDCNPTHWWAPEWGSPPATVDSTGADIVTIAPGPGTPYLLRDVDCLDGRLYGDPRHLEPAPARGTLPEAAWDLIPSGRDLPKASLVDLSSEAACPRPVDP